MKMNWIENTRIVKPKKTKLLENNETSCYLTASINFVDTYKAFAVNKNNEIISFSDKVYYGEPDQILDTYTFQELGVTENYFNKNYAEKDILFVIPFNKYIPPYKLEKQVRGQRKPLESEIKILKFLAVEQYCSGEKLNPFNIPNHIHEYCMENDLIDSLTYYQSHNDRKGIEDYINFFDNLCNK